MTHYIQTHKIAKQHPRPNGRKVELHFNLLTAFISAVYEPHLSIIWQRHVLEGAGGACVGFPCTSWSVPRQSSACSFFFLQKYKLKQWDQVYDVALSPRGGQSAHQQPHPQGAPPKPGAGRKGTCINCLTHILEVWNRHSPWHGSCNFSEMTKKSRSVRPVD